MKEIFFDLYVCRNDIGLCHLPALLCQLPLLLSLPPPPHCVFPRLTHPWTLWLCCFRQWLGVLWQLCELFVLEWERRGRRAVDGTQPLQQQQQQAPQETASGLPAGVNPPLRAMTRQSLSILTPLALLVLLAGFSDFQLGSVGAEEDYNVQELLTRETFNQVQELEKSSKPGGHEEKRQIPAKISKEKASQSSKKADKTPTDTKSGKSFIFPWKISQGNLPFLRCDFKIKASEINTSTKCIKCTF